MLDVERSTKTFKKQLPFAEYSAKFQQKHHHLHLHLLLPPGSLREYLPARAEGPFKPVQQVGGHEYRGSEYTMF